MYVLIFTIFTTTATTFSDVRGTVAMPFRNMEECRAAEAKVQQTFIFENYRVNTRCVVTDAFNRKAPNR